MMFETSKHVPKTEKRNKLDSIGSVDEAGAILVSTKGKPEALPPTSNALSLHVKRVHY